MQTEQKKLKKGGLIALVTVLGMAPPLSTDMYMPSLPWSGYVNGVAATMGIFIILATVCWLLLLRNKKISMKGIHR